APEAVAVAVGSVPVRAAREVAGCVARARAAAFRGRVEAVEGLFPGPFTWLEAVAVRRWAAANWRPNSIAAADHHQAMPAPTAMAPRHSPVRFPSRWSAAADHHQALAATAMAPRRSPVHCRTRWIAAADYHWVAPAAIVTAPRHSPVHCRTRWIAAAD